MEWAWERQWDYEGDLWGVKCIKGIFSEHYSLICELFRVLWLLMTWQAVSCNWKYVDAYKQAAAIDLVCYYTVRLTQAQNSCLYFLTLRVGHNSEGHIEFEASTPQLVDQIPPLCRRSPLEIHNSIIRMRIMTYAIRQALAAHSPDPPNLDPPASSSSPAAVTPSEEHLIPCAVKVTQSRSILFEADEDDHRDKRVRSEPETQATKKTKSKAQKTEVSFEHCGREDLTGEMAKCR